jgi:HEPN domain-containing protein
MSSDPQATAYVAEATLTVESARAIYRAACESGEALWADVVKNGYDAIEQAISAVIAASDESIPRKHPAKVNRFVDVGDPPAEIEEVLFYWLRRRSHSQYVDVHGGEVTVPHTQFDRTDAERILEDAETVLKHVQSMLD